VLTWREEDRRWILVEPLGREHIETPLWDGADMLLGWSDGWSVSWAPVQVGEE
jgi:hypothetical protein